MQREKITGLEEEFANSFVSADVQNTTLAKASRHGRSYAKACDLLLAEAKGWCSERTLESANKAPSDAASL